MFSVRPSVNRSSSRHGHHERRSSRSKSQDTTDEKLGKLSLSSSRHRDAAISVSSLQLQTTFENIRVIISSGGEGPLDRDSVVRMLDSIYEWMVFDKNAQLTMPFGEGCTEGAKVWPHGSTVDTRKPGDSGNYKSDPRYLKEVPDAHARAVASSVVSSSIGDEVSKHPVNRVMYSSQSPATSYQRPPPQLAWTHTPLRDHGPVQPPLPHGSHSQFDQARHQTLPPVGYSRPVYRHNGRYSMVPEQLEPPVHAVETPPLAFRETVKPSSKRRVNVGTAARGQSVSGGGTDVVFAD